MMSILKNPSQRDLRQFILLWFPLLVAVAGCMLYWKAGLPLAAIWLWSVGAATAVLGFAVPPLAKVLFLLLSYLTYPIGWLVGNAVMALVYFLVLFPIGLALRLRGFDPLGKRFDGTAKSYWIPRPKPAEKERYFRQF